MKTYEIEIIWKFESRHFATVEANSQREAVEKVEERDNEGEFGHERGYLNNVGVEYLVLKKGKRVPYYGKPA